MKRIGEIVTYVDLTIDEIFEGDAAVDKDTYELRRQSWLSHGIGMNFPQSTRRVINLRNLLLKFRDDPMSQAAIKKRSKDLFEAGFKITGLDDDSKLKADMENFVKNRAIRMAYNLTKAARDALIYGNGFLEIEYLNDDNEQSAELPGEGTDIVALHNINPEQMVIIVDDIPEHRTYGRITGYLSMPPTGGLNRFHNHLMVTESQVGTVAQSGKRLHPNRIIHVKFDTVGDSNVGTSILEPAFNIMRSKIMADEVLGTILVRFAKPVLEGILKKGAKPAEMKKFGKYLSAINSRPDKVSWLVHDENAEFKIPSMGGKSLNPKPYYDIILDQLAVNFGVPKRLLIGTESGTISGSELNLVAYFQSIESDQKTIIKPLILDFLNEWSITTRGKELPEGVDIEFGRLYADEIAAIKTNMLGMQTLVMAFQAGLITIKEARRRSAELLNVKNSENDKDFMDSTAKMFPPGKDDGKSKAFNPRQPGIKEPADEEEMQEIRDRLDALDELIERKKE